MNQHDSATGQDAFLDIVANLVGILIILIVVIGAQAASVWTITRDSELDEQMTIKEKQLEDRKEEAISLKSENDELHHKLKQELQIVDKLKSNRFRVLVALKEIERELDLKKSELDDEKAKEFETAANIDLIEAEILKTKTKVTAFTNLVSQQLTPKTQVIHYPTPIAKTVFSDEVHFLIKDNRIVHVPMIQLVRMMKNEWKYKAKSLESSGETWHLVGPVEDFRLRYLLQSVVPQNA
ncbi:MAG: hypothetical protein AAGA30_15670, partial [Planctomycetota bacterium]